jgi:choline dehydrogenase-like flavoprotein
LMLSGIGAPAALEALSIRTTLDRPGVGGNLQDHLLVAGVLLESPRAVPQSHFNHSESLAITHGIDSTSYADVLLLGLSVPFVLPGLATVPEHAFTVVPAFLKPMSRGEVTLVSADPTVAPRIDPGYLRESRDLDQLVHAIEVARELAHQPQLRDWVKTEVYPGPERTSRDALRTVARAAATSFYHPVGTCRAGAATDPHSVVDAQFRVHGMNNLRIVDASVFPSIPQAMTEASTLAVAEFAAATISTG